MENRFFIDPILNSPYEIPSQHWELDKDGSPTHKIIHTRRESSLLNPIPKPKKRGGKEDQRSLELGNLEISNTDQQYEVTQLINTIRSHINTWRQAPEDQWKVTPETKRLLKHWRNHKFLGIKPFFCQIEAVETAIWLTEVAPIIGKAGKDILRQLETSNDEANPGLSRIALKLATGAGKTTVMAMLIAWQTINAVRHVKSNRFTNVFLIIAPVQLFIIHVFHDNIINIIIIMGLSGLFLVAIGFLIFIFFLKSKNV